MKLRTRFTLFISASIIILFSGFITFLLLIERNHLRKESQEIRKETVSKLARVCRESFLSHDEIALFNYIRDIGTSSGVLWAMTVDSKGRVLMHSTLSERDTQLRDLPFINPSSGGGVTVERYQAKNKKILEYTMPVMVAGKPIAMARIGYDAEVLTRDVNGVLRHTLERILGVALLSLFVGALAAFYAANRLVHPILALMQGVQHIGEGNFRANIPVTGEDEIAQLALKFNWMAQKLQQLDALKDDFIAMVSHDLRNPLGAIVMNADLVLTQKDLTPDMRRGQLKVIFHSAQRLIGMVNDILDIAKMKSGKLEYHKTSIDPLKIIREVSMLYEVKAQSKGISLTPSLPSSLPSVEADEGMMHRVFNNILANAVKFTTEGGKITIGATADPREPWVRFFISDTGIGIPEADIPNIFRRFSSVSEIDSESQKEQGTGLGLMISKNIVEDHGGKIWVESKRGQGTIFYWTLPVAGKIPTPETAS